MFIDKKNQSFELSALESFGFSKRQARVYRDLLALGPSTAGPIVRKSGLHRQFVYSALAELEDLGFVSHALSRGRKVFGAARPDTLLHREAERMRELELVVPLLQSLAKTSHDELHVDVVKGREQFLRRLMQVVDSAARGDGIIRAIASVRDYDIYAVLGDSYHDYVRYCRSKRVKKRFIVPSAAISQAYERRLSRERGATIRVSDSGLALPTSTIITSELVAMDLFSHEIVSVMIWNKTIAKSFLEQFSAMWKGSAPYRKADRK
jgi:sugar-specific transcriptional regulator TrmB